MGLAPSTVHVGPRERVDREVPVPILSHHGARSAMDGQFLRCRPNRCGRQILRALRDESPAESADAHAAAKPSPAGRLLAIDAATATGQPAAPHWIEHAEIQRLSEATRSGVDGAVR